VIWFFYIFCFGNNSFSTFNEYKPLWSTCCRRS